MSALLPSTAFCASAPLFHARPPPKPALCHGPSMCTVPQTPSIKVQLDQVFAAISPPPAAPTLITSTPSPAQVEQEYKRAKQAYKEAKAAAKALRKKEKEAEKAAAKAAKREEKEKERTFGSVAGEAVGTVAVCGGKSCQKLGANIVADILGRAGVMPRGEIPNAPCMKMCGGGGPTVRMGEKCVKVDLKSAVLDTVQAEQPEGSTGA